MTLRDIQVRLLRAGIENAAEEARVLAAHFSGVSDALLRAQPTAELADPDGALERAVSQREGHYPLQYLLGMWGFWRQEYEVSPDCLIPRSDTEMLLEYVVRHAPLGGRVLDLCTGSGCIAISLLCERPDLSAVAVDLYENTLDIAKRNAVRNGVGKDRLTFLRFDVLDGGFISSLGQFDMILSNPPYIPARVVDTLAPELHYEPRAALDGGEDGLTFYRRMLAADYRAALREGGSFAFEIGYDQADDVRTLAGKDNCEILCDLGGRARVAIVTPAHTLE
ncbi:MAG: peptide chain release factor N(5)-glutamine methyltransferase [Clostridia bacterium]|nr:peptide chain release factor N(5)-glutamine methyltransferase [Clostridia bacterium]